MANAVLNTESSTQINAVAATSNFLIINPANQINCVKLTDDNYLLWNLQVLAGIRGLGLDLFILEHPPVPSRVTINDDSSEMLNPNLVTWCRQDQLLFSFLLASMSESVQGQMIGCETSSQLWARVSRLFATRSKARVMQYKLQLQTLKKGGLSMKDYLAKMKGYIDILAACGHSISEEDQILYVLGGIGLEYDSVVVHVTSRVDSLSVSEVSALLLAHEGRIDSFHSNTTNVLPTANIVTAQNQGKPEHSSQNIQRGRGRGRNNRGGRRSWNTSNGRPVCQICGYTGHVAEKCYYRFDPDFVPNQRQQGVVQGQHKFPPPRPVAALATAKSEPFTDEWWYPDSGATHHVTSELGNLTLGSEYSGTGKVHMGNGAGPSNTGGSSSRELA